MKKLGIAVLFSGLTSIVFAAPPTVIQTVTYNSETITMRLTLQNLRGANFELWAQNATGGYDVITPVAERSYIGTVDEYPGAVSCGILLDNGSFKGAVYFDRGATWYTLDNAVSHTKATPESGIDYTVAGFTSYAYPSKPTVASGQAGATCYGFELALDASYQYHSVRGGGNLAVTFEKIEHSVCLVRALYMKDALLRPYLGRIIIRTSQSKDWAEGTTGGGYLNELTAEWGANQADSNHDLVAGLSTGTVGGGLAWVGVVGQDNGTSVNDSDSDGDFTNIFRHEMGHNWGCGHYVGGAPEGTGIMGGNKPARFSGCELYLIFNERNEKLAFLDHEGTYTTVALPPYASMDAGEFIQTVTSSRTFDVLANDHDANGQAISLYSYDSTSAHGGTVTQQGQNLAYTAPGEYLGTDYFMYTITDTAGQTATGVVIIDIQPNDALQLYLPLDEMSGTSADDLSSFNNNGTLAGTDFSASSVAGPFGNAINLDGVDDHIEVPNVRINTNTVTITAWVKQGATQNDWAGIAMDRSNAASGLSIRNTGELRYTWNDMASTYNWSSGLTPPAGTWTFVALVIEPSKATIYMNAGSGFQSAVKNATHAPAIFNTTYIGSDPHNAARHFNGAIDDVRIYNYSLTQAELGAIVAGGKACSPTPFDEAVAIDQEMLKWVPGAAATGYDVYLGTDMTAVANATQASPEYKGSVTTPQYAPPLATLTPYYWRIDTVTAAQTLTGDVWSFTTAATMADPVVVNGNFENRSGYGQYSGSANWTISAAGGWVDVPGNTAIFTTDADGYPSGTYLFLQGAGSATSDGVVGPVETGTEIMAAVKVGRPKSSYSQQPNAYGLEILLDGVVVASTGPKDIITDLGAAADSWVTLDLVYTVLAADAGKETTFRIINYNAAQAFIDNVSAGFTRADTDADGIPDLFDPDDDNDGMPDVWEIDHLLDPLVDDAALHSDSDAFDNWFEYVTDTDPQDGNSMQTCSVELAPGTGDPMVRFGSSAGRNYAVEYRPDLTTGSWQDLGPVSPGTGSEMTVSDPAMGPQGYYRLRVELP